jgi:hypothetical protein
MRWSHWPLHALRPRPLQEQRSVRFRPFIVGFDAVTRLAIFMIAHVQGGLRSTQRKNSFELLRFTVKHSHCPTVEDGRCDRPHVGCLQTQRELASHPASPRFIASYKAISSNRIGPATSFISPTPISSPRWNISWTSTKTRPATYSSLTSAQAFRSSNV